MLDKKIALWVNICETSSLLHLSSPVVRWFHITESIFRAYVDIPFLSAYRKNLIIIFKLQVFIIRI